MTHLKLLNSPNGMEYPLTKDSILIGRNPKCDIAFDQPSVSRTHARILTGPHGFAIEDLRSSNGTFLNGSQVMKREPLYHGDHIQIADLEFLFESDQPEAQRSKTDFFVHKPAGMIYLDESISRDSISFSSQIDLRDLNRMAEPSLWDEKDSLRKIKALENKLNVMTRIIKILGKVTTLDELIPQVLDALLRLFPQADFVSLLALNPKTKKLELVNYKISESQDPDPIRISRSIPQYVFDMEKAILSSDPGADLRFDSSESVIKSNIASIMAVPIIEQTSRETIGVIQIDSRTGHAPFTDVDLDLLVSVANQVAVFHENLRYQDIRRQEDKLDQEMTLAHQVQKGFLPTKQPTLKNYAFYDFYRPAQAVGGDYFDYIKLPDGRQVVVIADVSGKGIPAALLMAKLSSEVRSALLLEKGFSAAMRRVNQAFCDAPIENRFITMVLVVINPFTDEIQLFNAGHLFPILHHSDGSLELIGEGRQGFPIGVIPMTDYEEILFRMAAKDSMILMSDGITDAVNDDGQYFGNGRVIAFLKQETAWNAEDLGERLIQSVCRFVGETKQSDDQTLVVIERR